MRRWSLAALAALLLVACGGQDAPRVDTSAPASIDLTSPAFEDGDAVPPRHTCDGEDVAPPLRWSGVPDGAATLALVLDDPDAPGGRFVHWLLAGLPTASAGLGGGRDRP
ncbi:MAG TPA: YbhB/YbcL family Raf kinase inhibitor-like protein, partial [Nitriliruptorales bacterium]|nr:YbhB/YbcL family Raf kinase inhibitor-like protein [Nitriliruptorales bacterium]